MLTALPFVGINEQVEITIMLKQRFDFQQDDGKEPSSFNTGHEDDTDQTQCFTDLQMRGC